MTTKELIPILEAFVAGKEIECFDQLSKEFNWSLVDNTRFDCWNLSRFNFRIKRQPCTFYIQYCKNPYHNAVSVHPISAACDLCEQFTHVEP